MLANPAMPSRKQAERRVQLKAGTTTYLVYVRKPGTAEPGSILSLVDMVAGQQISRVQSLDRISEDEGERLIARSMLIGNSVASGQAVLTPKPDPFPEYSLGAAMAVATQLIAPEKKEFALLNLMEPASPKTVRMVEDAIRQGTKAKIVVALAAPRDEFLFGALEQALQRVHEPLPPWTLLVVSDAPDLARYETLLSGRSAQVTAGAYRKREPTTEPGQSSTP